MRHNLSNPLLLTLLGALTVVLLGQAKCSGDDQDEDGWTTEQGDCDDGDPGTHPGAVEVCDGLDTNCDGQVDEELPYFLDSDGDGFGDDDAVVSTCSPSSTMVLVGGDCDDTLKSNHPGAPEPCDGVDNDCDGAIDEGFFTRFFLDQDGDGFGTDADVTCSAQTGYAPAHGDCDDARPSVHPGAKDTAGDGVDSDCGGSDAPEPHVGFSSASATSLQQALARATPNTTVWVGPGTYHEHDLTLPALNFSLRSTGGAGRTTVDAQQQGRIFSLSGAQGVELHVDGFTFSNGLTSENGGAGLISAATLTLQDCRFSANRAAPGDDRPGDRGEGGALHLSQSQATLVGVTFDSNTAEAGMWLDCTVNTNPCDESYYGGMGAGVMAEGSTLDLRGDSFQSNTLVGKKTYGAGLYLLNSSADVNGGEFLAGSSVMGGGIFLESSTLDASYTRIHQNRGGGIQAHLSSVRADNSVFSANVATSYYGYGYGGGIGLNVCDIQLSYCQFLDNVSNYAGGGLSIGEALTTPAVIRNTVFRGNSARLYGGAVYTETSLELDNATVTDNFSAEGGAVAAFSDCELTLRNVILHDNPGYNLYLRFNGTGGCPGNIGYVSTSNRYGKNFNFSEPDPELLAGTIYYEAPDFVRFTRNLDASDDDLHLMPDSALRDMGDPATVDGDGTRAELGAFGVDLYSTHYYQDDDHDGMYEGWEESMGLSPYSPDSNADPDHDGLPNLNELGEHTFANAADSDHDGSSDGTEFQAGSDGLNWYSRPASASPSSGEVRVSALVPDDFPSIQAALNAIQDQGDVRVRPGTYEESLQIRNKMVDLSAFDPATAPLIHWPSGSVFTMTGGELNLSHMSFDGSGCVLTRFGSMPIFNTTAQLLDVQLDHGCGESMLNPYGAFHLGNSSVTASELRISNSQSMGLSMFLSEATLENASVTGSLSTGIRLDYLATLTLSNSVVEGNQYSGIRTNAPGYLTVEHSRIINNYSWDYGGGVAITENANQDTAVFSHVLFEGNVSHYGGSAVDQHIARVGFDHCVFANNVSERNQGAINVEGTPITSAAITHSILAFNNGYNLISLPDGELGNGSPPVVTLSYSDLYSPTGSENYDLAGLPLGATNLTVEPGFLMLDATGAPVDFHLALTSRLVNAGGGSDVDVDGSAVDLGLYGGKDGAGFDLDMDGRKDYFWPGSFADVPAGTTSSGYDADDLDPSR